MFQAHPDLSFGLVVLLCYGGFFAELTALRFVFPQQEGLDDGPDFLSEEDRGVSLTVWHVCLFGPVLFGSDKLALVPIFCWLTLA